MIRFLRTLLCLGVLAAASAIGAHPVFADAPPAPVLTSVTPGTVIANGQEIRLLVTGLNLAGVNAVVVSPPVAQRGFTVLNDNLIQVVLPADMPPDTYTLRVLTPAGGAGTASELAFSVGTVLVPPPPGPTLPPYQAPAAVAPGSPSNASRNPAPGRARVGTLIPGRSGPSLDINPAIVITAGLLAGGLAYALWGSAGRVAVARRRGLLAQIVARPAQRLRLARICLQCGKLHWLWRTHRQLWRAGHFCSATCLTASQADDITAEHGKSVAPSRLREMVVYQDMQKDLDGVLQAEQASLGAAEILFAADLAEAISGTGRLQSSLPRDDRPGAALTESPAIDVESEHGDDHEDAYLGQPLADLPAPIPMPTGAGTSSLRLR